MLLLLVLLVVVVVVMALTDADGQRNGKEIGNTWRRPPLSNHLQASATIDNCNIILAGSGTTVPLWHAVIGVFEIYSTFSDLKVSSFIAFIIRQFCIFSFRSDIRKQQMHR